MTSVVSRDICPAHHRSSAHGPLTDGLARRDRRHPSPPRSRRGQDVPGAAVRRDDPRGPPAPPLARDPRRDRGHRHLHPHVRGARVRRPRRLAQLRALHRSSVLEEPAGARPARRAGARGRRQGVRHAPARVHPRRPDPVDDLGLRPGPPGPSGSAHPQRPARPLRRVPHGPAGCAATGATSPSPTARWPPAGRRPTARPVRRTAPDDLRRRAAGAPSGARRRRPGGPAGAPGAGVVRRPAAALARGARDQQHAAARSAGSPTPRHRSTAGTSTPRSARATSPTPTATTSSR